MVWGNEDSPPHDWYLTQHRYYVAKKSIISRCH
jgi:hypothetical protein